MEMVMICIEFLCATSLWEGARGWVHAGDPGPAECVLGMGGSALQDSKVTTQTQTQVYTPRSCS